MRALEFLERPNLIAKQITSALRKVDLYRSMTQRITCSLEGEVVSRTRDVTSNETAIIKLMEAEEVLTKLRSEYAAVVEEVTTVVETLADEFAVSILIQRYIENKPVSEISKMLNLSRTRVYVHLDTGISELDKLLEKSGRNGTQRDTTGRNGT